MIYPQKLSSKKNNIIIKISLIASLGLAVIFIILNRILTPQIHWSAIANATIIYI